MSIQASVRPPLGHAGPAASQDERRNFLRLCVGGSVNAVIAGQHRQLACVDLSMGGMCVTGIEALETDARFWVEALEFSGRSFELQVEASVAWQQQGKLPSAPKVGGVHFVDLNTVQLSRLEAAFDGLLARAAREPGREWSMRGGEPAISHVATLIAICREWLALAGLADLWSDSGPTTRARNILRGGARELPESQRVALMFAWRLWNGLCDLRLTELWLLEYEQQVAVASLIHAVETHRTVDWLKSCNSLVDGPAAP